MTPKEVWETPKDKALKEMQEFHECFYDYEKSNTAELKRKSIEDYINKTHKVLYEMHEENLIVNQKLEQALERAKKVEELLNQIKEIIDRQDDSYISSMLEESRSYYKIKELIKELEE